MHRVTQAELASSDRLYQVPIGKPVPGWQCFLYDDETDTVINPIDAAAVCAGTTRSASGVCYVRGPGVLKAYLNRDDLTQAAFLSAHDRSELHQSPRENVHNALCFRLPVPLFRIGDVCHYNADGALVFEGRCNTQLQQCPLYFSKNRLFCCRRDNQIKIQGQRMEPGEVEAVVASMDDVSGCVVKLIKPVQVNNGTDRCI